MSLTAGVTLHRLCDIDGYSNARLREMILARQSGATSGPITIDEVGAPAISSVDIDVGVGSISCYDHADQDHDVYDGPGPILSGTRVYAHQAFRLKHRLFASRIVSDVIIGPAASVPPVAILLFAIPCRNSDPATQESQVFESTGKSVVVCIRYEGDQQYRSCSCNVRDH